MQIIKRINLESGIYIHNPKYNVKIDEHSLTIMGWGEQNGVKYWLIQDSYGESKGDHGFIKVKIGDSSGAGLSAFCDEVEDEYIEYDEEDFK